MHKLYYPEDKLPLTRLVPMGLQHVVAIIGLNLSSSAVSNFINADFRLANSADALNMGVACVTFAVAAGVSLYTKGFLRLLPILSGVLAGYALSLALGLVDPAHLEAIRSAPWAGLPPFVAPVFSLPALLLVLCPKFGALVQSIPNPVLGGVTVILYGLIALMGVKIWLDASVDFCSHKNLLIAGSSIIISTGLGVKGFTAGPVNIAGIAFGTVLAVLMNLALAFGGGDGGAEKQDHAGAC